MIRVLVAAAVLLTAVSQREPISPRVPDAAELTKLLREFLAGASRNDPATHDRFWSDDLVYTGSSGLRRVGKEDVLKGVLSAPSPRPGDPTTTYGAEDVRVRQFGDTAVVDFRLTGTTEKAGRTEVASYLNTGTFLKRDGVWKVVAWQATKVPRTAEEARLQVAAAHAAFVRALAAGDAKSLETMLTDDFVWTPCPGEPLTRARLLEKAGQTKDPKLGTTDATVSVHGDAAVVRSASHALTFVDDGGTWKVVALLTGHP
jgi:ketosteroid isomerase-like protein